jgi:hypothetical protein
MATFTIDSDHNIVAYAGEPPTGDHLQPFSNEKELGAIARDWPASRLVEIWNSFAGVAPFDDLKPVKKFTSRTRAIARIWQAVERLALVIASPEKKPKQTQAKRAKAPKGTEPGRNKKAEVIAMMKRSKGVTLGAIIAATGWQKHTVRGLVSILGSKDGHKIDSSKNAAGERYYRITK